MSIQYEPRQLGAGMSSRTVRGLVVVLVAVGAVVAAVAEWAGAVGGGTAILVWLGLGVLALLAALLLLARSARRPGRPGQQPASAFEDRGPVRAVDPAAHRAAPAGHGEPTPAHHGSHGTTSDRRAEHAE